MDRLPVSLAARTRAAARVDAFAEAPSAELFQLAAELAASDATPAEIAELFAMRAKLAALAAGARDPKA